MAYLKKTIARLVVQGIGIISILFGLTCFYLAAFEIVSILRGNRTELWFSLFFSGWMLVLAAFLVSPSYLMLRGKSFEVIRSISALLALIPFGLIAPLIRFLETKFVDEKRFMGDMVVLAAVLCVYLLSVLVYLICKKLLNKILKAAYGPAKISGVQNSTD